MPLIGRGRADVRTSAHRGYARDLSDKPAAGHGVGMSQFRELSLFSLYDMHVVNEEQIQKWADEAEAGYDVMRSSAEVVGVPVAGLNQCRSWRCG